MLVLDSVIAEQSIKTLNIACHIAREIQGKNTEILGVVGLKLGVEIATYL